MNPIGEQDVGGVRLIFAHLATPHMKRPLCCVFVPSLLIAELNAHKGMVVSGGKSNKTGKLKAARVVVVVLHCFHYALHKIAIGMEGENKKQTQGMGGAQKVSSAFEWEV